MKIDPRPAAVGSAAPTDGMANTQETQAVRAAQGSDATSSTRADEGLPGNMEMDVLHAQKSLAGAPEVRQDKVDQVRQQIADGTFQIDAELIATGVMEGGL